MVPSVETVLSAHEPKAKLQLLRQMVRLRCFEGSVMTSYQGGKICGFLQLYTGQESVAVGTCSQLTPNDHVITGYRCLGHALAMGMTMKECMAELLGKATGCSHGKGGSMHLFSPAKNFWGGIGVAGAQTPLGLGLAFALKYKGIQGASLCYLGDGAVNQGCFYESLNMASLFDLPVIYIIENNHYALGTSVAASSAFRTCLAERGEVFNIQWRQVDASHILDVVSTIQWALKLAREESRPTIIECDTYRYYGHSVADAKHRGGYRSAEEIATRRAERDPIDLFKKQLLEEGILTENIFSEMNDAAKNEAEEAARYADESPLPTPESIFEDVYYEVDHHTEAGRTGTHFFNLS